MKIRTGFVTNSSSYSSAVIRIQSRKLASLLKEYEELFMKIYDDGSIDKSVLFHDAYVRGWTFYVVQDEVADYWADTPTELNSVLDCLINGLGYYHRTENQESERKQKELLKELKAQKQWMYKLSFEKEREYYRFIEKDFLFTNKDPKRLTVRLMVDMVELNQLIPVLSELNVIDISEIPYTLEDHFMRFYKEEEEFLRQTGSGFGVQGGVS